jgi:hypothetical protein
MSNLSSVKIYLNAQYFSFYLAVIPEKWREVKYMG